MPTELLDTDAALSDVDGDTDVRSHFVRREDATRAYVTGEAIQALCGKRWVPSRDPDRFPMCDACESAMASMRARYG